MNIKIDDSKWYSKYISINIKTTLLDTISQCMEFYFIQPFDLSMTTIKHIGSKTQNIM